LWSIFVVPWGIWLFGLFSRVVVLDLMVELIKIIMQRIIPEIVVLLLLRVALNRAEVRAVLVLVLGHESLFHYFLFLAVLRHQVLLTEYQAFLVKFTTVRTL
jgi:hypothetical protein